ncbi:MAG TPA: glycosyltransferase [Gemmataceae bacterium]|nr:glycosyltransferase [Gemmataceae bacterium]
MRVALLAHNARSKDAIGNQLAAKVAALRERGDEVEVFLESRQHLHPQLLGDIQLVTADCSLEALAEQLRSYHLLIVEYSQYFRALEALPLLAGSGVRILFDYHGVTPPQHWRGSREALTLGQQYRGLVWFADAVAVHSRFMRDEITQPTGYPVERVHSVPLLVDMQNLSPAPSRFLQEKLRLPDARFLLFVGRLAANKRVPVLIRALALLRELQPPVHAAIIGDAGDVYQAEAAHCRQLAEALGVAERVHFLGHTSDEQLAAAYRSASLLVMPSIHEGFCLPLVEAMAYGLPIVTARAAALPETAGNAGALFTPDDPADLAKQLRRLLVAEKPQPAAPAQPNSRRIAVVVPRFGEEVLGGAERSLRLMAETLAEAGYEVELFSTGSGVRSASKGNLTIHRFATDPQDEENLAAAVAALRQPGMVADSSIRDFLQQTLLSRELLDAVVARQHHFAAILAGPYGNGLIWELCRALPEKVILVPCFHDEPLARQTLVRESFRDVAGILYHCVEEQQLAEEIWNLRIPNAHVVGTVLSMEMVSESLGACPADLPERYVLYSGRYCQEKNLLLLLDWAQRYRAERADRFAFVFTGHGEVPIPREPNFFDLGFVPEATRSEILGKAAALILLSTNESLSLVALEAWREGVPVIAHENSAVLRGHVQRGGGGKCVQSYSDFRAALDALWDARGFGRELGRKGREYVRRTYGSKTAFLSILEFAIAELQRPLVERLRRNGLERARAFSPERWREAFLSLVDNVGQATSAAKMEALEIIPPRHEPALNLTPRTRRLPVRLRNTGTLPLLPNGPAAKAVWTGIFTTDGEPVNPPVSTPLPKMLLPEETVPARIQVDLPARFTEYRLGLHFGAAGEKPQEMQEFEVLVPCRVQAEKSLNLETDFHEDPLPDLLEEAEQLHHLPAGYVDVCEGRLADWKRKIKRKLLHQFQTSYVDVLSRQQSGFNRQTLAILHELTERLNTLEQRLTQLEQIQDELAAPCR